MSLDFIDDETRTSLAEDYGHRLFDEGAYIGDDIVAYAECTAEDVRQRDVILDNIESVEASDVEIVEGDELPRLIVASLRMYGQVTIVNWFIGGLDAQLLDESAWVDCAIHVPVSVDLDESWAPIAFQVDDRAQLRMRY